MLTEVADGVFVRQSRFCQSNAVVIRSEDGVVLVDPGVDGRDLNELAGDVEALGAAVTAGFSTHPHWDHVLWHDRFGGDVPRYAASACVAFVQEHISVLREMTARYAHGAPLELVGGITPLPPGSTHVPPGSGMLRAIEHRAHAPGHAALIVEGSGVLVAGDMLSDVEIPLFDTEASDPCGDYLVALDLLDSAITDGIVAVIPGHGRVARGSEIRSRLDADRSYVQALFGGVDACDPRVGPGASYGRDWLPGAHERNVSLAKR